MRSEPCRHHGKIHYAFFSYRSQCYSMKFCWLCNWANVWCIWAVYVQCNVKMSLPRVDHIIILFFFFISLKILTNADSSSSFSLYWVYWNIVEGFFVKLSRTCAVEERQRQETNTCIFQHCPLICSAVCLGTTISHIRFHSLFDFFQKSFCRSRFMAVDSY